MAIDNNSKEKLVKSLKKQIDKYIKDYLKQSVKTKNTPSVSAMQQEISNYAEELAQTSKELSYYSPDVIQDITMELKSYAWTEAKTKYDKSLEDNPREVNDVSPITRDPSSGAQTSKSTIIQQIKNVLNTGMNNFLTVCRKTKQCPDEAQMSDYIDGMISAAERQLIPSNITEKDKADIEKAIKKYKEELLKRYREFAADRVITHTIPSEADVEKVLSNPKTYQTTKKVRDNFIQTSTTFSGCDMLVDAQIWIDGTRCVSVSMGSLATLSYSVFQQKFPINAIGNVNAKDYVLGPRTIAGSMVFIVFNQHWASELLKQFKEAIGKSAADKVLVDEIAPIDLTVSMANEYGFQSRLAIYGVRFFSEGQVMSIQDMYTENTYQYVALNIDYLSDIDGDFEDIGNNSEETTDENTNLPTVLIPNSGGEQNDPKVDAGIVEAYAIKYDWKELLQENDTATYFNTAVNAIYGQKVQALKKDLKDGKITQDQYNQVLASYQSTISQWISEGNAYYANKAKQQKAALDAINQVNEENESGEE